jgi:hypothetical protein
MVCIFIFPSIFPSDLQIRVGPGRSCHSLSSSPAKIVPFHKILSSVETIDKSQNISFLLGEVELFLKRPKVEVSVI